MSKKKRAKAIEPSRSQNAVLFISIAEIAAASFTLIMAIMALVGLQNAEVQSALADALAQSSSTLSFDDMLAMITTASVIELICGIGCVITGIFGIRISQDNTLALTYSKLCLFTLVLAGVGAVASIQADTIFISFVLLAITALLYFYVKKVRIEAESQMSKKHRKKR
ncbi:MAG: hypothetical protein ACI361_02235 [Atopobiaceae bacterium]